MTSELELVTVAHIYRVTLDWSKILCSVNGSKGSSYSGCSRSKEDASSRRTRSTKKSVRIILLLANWNAARGRELFHGIQKEPSCDTCTVSPQLSVPSQRIRWSLQQLNIFWTFSHGILFSDLRRSSDTIIQAALNIDPRKTSS